MHPDWRGYFATEWTKLIRGMNPPFYEYQIITKSGAVKWLNQRNTLIRDAEGRPIALEGIVTDITERVVREERVRRYMELISGLIGTREVYAENPLGVLPAITERAAHAIGVERASIWFYNDDFTEIRCHDLFELSKGVHSSGETLRSADFPEYTASHREGQVIAAGDVFTDPRTYKIPGEYYRSAGIVSLLDAPIWVGGGLVALLSFEHTGKTPREWIPEEEHLALTLAAHAAASIESSRRNEAEKALRLSEQRIQIGRASCRERV